jgi:uncharacterized membrane protein YbhN (UPF0104 family)
VAAIWQTIVTSVGRLSAARLPLVLAALGLYVVSLFITGARWRGFLRALGGDASLLRAALATLGGISVGNLTPSSRLAGEACRIALVRSAGRATWGQATTAAVWDRLSEVPPLAVLAVMATVALGGLSSAWRVRAIVGGAVVATAALLLAIRGARRLGARLAGWRRHLARGRVPLRVFAAGVGFSTLLWLQDVLRLMCVSLAFRVALAPPRLAMLSILTMLGGLVPTLGGLGAVEGGLVTGLIACGVDVPTAAAITAAERLISYGFSTTAGGLVVAWLGGRSLWTASRSRQAPDEIRQP